MKTKDKLIKIGSFNKAYNKILSSNFPLVPIYRSEGLKKHIAKRHPEFVNRIDKIQEILSSPDYIGMRDNRSVELIKICDENLLLALQLDISDTYFYVSSLYDISSSKLKNRLYSGRLKPTKVNTE